MMHRLQALTLIAVVANAPAASPTPPAGPAETLRAAGQASGLFMEGAHHRPIRSLALPGHESFAWVTGDVGKATRERDALQRAGEVGYGMRVGADSVLGLALGYAEHEQSYDGNPYSAGRIHSTFLATDLGFGAGRGEMTLTFAYSHSEVNTLRTDLLGSFPGSTDGNTYTFRARYDHPVGTLGAAALGAFASATYDHSDLNHFGENGGGAQAYDNQSNDSVVARLGLTAKLALGAATDLGITAEIAKMLNENRDDHDGTDMATGVVDFTMADVRGKRSWGRLGLDLDHRLSKDAVISLTLQASTRGEAFDTTAALSLRKGL